MDELLRGDDERVDFVELFYDLVFVFAITQLSHLLLRDYSLIGAAHAGFLFLAVWCVWIYTTWVLNRLAPDRGMVRAMLFAMMVGGLFLSMAIPDAFRDRGLVFALAFVAMQVGRTLFMFWAARRNAVLHSTYQRILIWVCVSGLVWIGGGLAVPEVRLEFWLLALGLDYLGPALGFAVPGLGRDATANWTVRGAHLAERCGLFVIICLGETLLISGATFAGMEWDGPGLGAFLAAIGTTIGMWWLYFHLGHRRGSGLVETSTNPGRQARQAFTFAHIPVVAGIVLSAVGSERAIAHPLHHGNVAEAASAIGGVALFLLGNGLFQSISAARFPLSHLAGLGLCGVVAVTSPSLSLVALNLAAAAILGGVAVGESITARPAARVDLHD